LFVSHASYAKLPTRLGEEPKSEVIKRETLESDAGIEANKQVTKFIKKQARAKTKAKTKEVSPQTEDVPTIEH